jgi:hypothetical protein
VKGNWPGKEFVEVRAYAWPDDKETDAVILAGMKLKDGVINKEGSVLTPAQVEKLLSAVTGKHPPHRIAKCHIPHNAFVFYDASKTPIAYVEICFKCLSYRTEPDGAAQAFDLVALASIFHEHKLPMGEYEDLPSFEAAFRKITKE